MKEFPGAFPDEVLPDQEKTFPEEEAFPEEENNFNEEEEVEALLEEEEEEALPEEEEEVFPDEKEEVLPEEEEAEAFPEVEEEVDTLDLLHHAFASDVSAYCPSAKTLVDTLNIYSLFSQKAYQLFFLLFTTCYNLRMMI